MSSSFILAGSKSTSRSLSLKAGHPVAAGINMYLIVFCRDCKLALICPVNLNRYLLCSDNFIAIYIYIYIGCG